MTVTLTNIENVSDDAASALNGARGFASISIGGVNYLYVAGAVDDSINIYRLNPDGTAVFLNAILDTDNPLYNLDGVWEMSIMEVSGNSYLVAPGRFDHGVSLFRINADGSLSNTFNQVDTGSLNLTQPLDSLSVTKNGVTYLYIAGELDHGISIFRVDANGNAPATLINIQNVNDTASLELKNAVGLTSAEVAGVDYLFVSSFVDDGVSVFLIYPNGTVINTFNVTDSDVPAYLMNAAINIETAEVNGITYLYVQGFYDDGLTVFRVNPGGTLTFVDAVSDNATLNLDGVYDAKVMQIGGLSYLATVGQVDSGISLFRIDDNGTLTNIANLNDTAVTNLSFSSNLEYTMIDGVPLLYASGDFDNGFSGFMLNFPITISNAAGTYDVSESLTGAASVAVAKSTISVTTAALYSAGAEYVNVDADQLTFDLTTGVIATFYMGEMADYLTITGTGITTIYGKQSAGDRITGGAGLDTIYSSGGDDVVKTKGGNDIVYLGTGDDRVFGDAGNEVFYGGTGSDRLFGYGGNDELYGQSGTDYLYGGAGDDFLSAGRGNDTLKGGAGVDQLWGNLGSDRMFGGAGNDILNGEDGKDYLYGDGGDDTLYGGTGNDTMTGGAGADTFQYFSDADEGYDKIKDFQNGTDLIDLTDWGLVDFSDVSALTTQIAAGVKINFGSGNVLLLEGFTLADFDASDVML